MEKIIKFPTFPEAMGIVVVMLAANYVINHFLPASVKTIIT